MDNRAWESGAAGSPPSAPASPSVGYPTGGDPQTAIPATKPGPYWFYQLGEELRAILTAAGITPDKAVLTQLLTALRSAGVFQTPAQFDNTTKAATTAFVQRALGNMQGAVDLATTTTLTAADVGKAYLCYGGTGFSINLPASSSCPAGAVIEIESYLTAGNAVTINRAGADQIYGNQSGVTSLTLNSGESARLVNSASGNRWVITSGTALLPFSTMFGASKASAGYQKLPSGLIIQWGTSGSVPASSTLNVTLPITFPTAFLQCVTCVLGGPSAGSTLGCSPVDASTIQITNGATSTPSARWFAIGH